MTRDSGMTRDDGTREPAARDGATLEPPARDGRPRDRGPGTALAGGAATERTGVTAPRSRHSVRIGRIAGIEIRVHATFALLVAVVALASGAPGAPPLPSQLAWLVLLFGCIVLHELAHALTAQRYGVVVSEIELLPIGGLSKMTSQPPEPRRQLHIAAAGPLASIALAAGLALVAAAGGLALWPPTLMSGPFLVRAAWLNLVLGGFNLLPAFPMDGGRVLRAVLAEHMDGQRATRWAAHAGRSLAIAMIVGGLYLNVWLVFIGVFVYFGSWTEEFGAAARTVVAELHVRDVMVAPDPEALAEASGEAEPADAAISETDLLGRDFVARPVVRDGRVVGVIRAEDLDTRILQLTREKLR